ncbi:NAD-dependent protein deacetylase [Microlunatus speluncae]|uniref:NAD-dependent protein deacetylase n=1 Tax=Microlunatus speluncae TaxID=2594267 RepID=UPI001FE4B11C|nr:NAD-dependent protein deacetylase [Microlunatus speluncae]
MSLIDRVADQLRDRRWVVLTGAGVSTDSGIPDYRGPDARPAAPMMYGEFAGSLEARRRYWARSFQGWRQIGVARPNAGHRALVRLEAAGLAGVVTQNVDGLHEDAGSSRVIDLHGRIDQVICLDCGLRVSRATVQDQLEQLNPGIGPAEQLDHAELRPDGDAVVAEWDDFVLVDCERCGGRLKPDVVFFGESVPRDRVAAAYSLVDEGEVLLVAGSSLTVMSGLRFVRHAWKAGRPVIIVNRGETRGDEFAMIKIEDGTSEVLGRLSEELTTAGTTESR